MKKEFDTKAMVFSLSDSLAFAIAAASIFISIVLIAAVCSLVLMMDYLGFMIT